MGENLSSWVCSSPRMPDCFLLREAGGRVMCLRCVLSTRHEYGADRSPEAAENDGMELRTASAVRGAGPEEPGWSGGAAAEISTDIFSCLGSPSACSRFAMLFTKTGSQAFF